MILYVLFFLGDWGWGLGIGDWGLRIGPNPQSPIPNPQSPIPNPHKNKKNNLKIFIIIYFLFPIILIFKLISILI